jgi:hypothetical protein
MSRFALKTRYRSRCGDEQFIYDLDGIVTDTEEERQFALCFSTQEEAYAAALEWCSDLEVVDLDVLGVPVPTEAAERKYHDKVWGRKMPFWMDDKQDVIQAHDCLKEN